jgi:hypothetical protein
MVRSECEGGEDRTQERDDENELRSNIPGQHCGQITHSTLHDYTLGRHSSLRKFEVMIKTCRKGRERVCCI